MNLKKLKNKSFKDKEWKELGAKLKDYESIKKIMNLDLLRAKILKN